MVHIVASRFSYVTSGLKFTIGRYLILIPDMAQLLWPHCQQGRDDKRSRSAWSNTYRRPNEKTRMRRSRCLIETFMRHKSGMGNVNITISLSMLPAEWMYH